MQTLTSYYPVICTRHGEALVTFLKDLFEFEAVYTADWYWHLSLPKQPNINIAILDPAHESLPTAYRKPAQGVLINLELEDVTAFYSMCVEKNIPFELALRDEPWGQRHFIVAAPGCDVLFDIIQVIPATSEFTANYNDQTTSA